MPTAAQVIVDTLVNQGISHAFAVPGESYLPVLDALYEVKDRLRLITCRHEAAASNMAEAYGKLTGKPGVALVTRGPGATQASVGVHTARQDSTPMLLLVGQVGTDMLQREAFQEIEYRLMFAAVAKRVFVIDRADRAAELVAAAYSQAVSGRPGPVIVVLPEDVLGEEARPAVTEQIAPVEAAPDDAAITRLAEILEEAERPILWVGGPCWSNEAGASLKRFVQASGLPVVTSWRRKDRFDNMHPNYVGELGLGDANLLRRFALADLVVALGTRLGEVTTEGYGLLDLPCPKQRLVHIHPDGDTLGAVYRPALAIQASMRLATAALADLGPLLDAKRWAAWTQASRADYEAWTAPTPVGEGVNMAEVVAHLDAVMPEDTVYANGAGNFAAWLQRFHQYRSLGTQLAPTSGAMGYGIPAGIAAKLLSPQREVVVVAGDGDFLMSSQELATAVHHDANIIILIVDNGQYGTIRMHQTRRYPGRPHGTSFTNPDFARFAQSFGAFGVTIDRTEEFPEALANARSAGVPAVIALKTHPDEIAPGRRVPAGA
jgi:acetolactate synthase I/II/III large subunit